MYCGDIGAQLKTLLNYFARNGARRCGAQENPAEYVLDMIAREDNISANWVEEWNNSPELQEVLAELTLLESSAESTDDEISTMEHLDAEFAVPLYSQLRDVALRAFQQCYRQPEYIFAMFLLGLLSGLFIGFSFWKADHTQQGFQNALFSVFLLCTIFSTLVNQVMAKFVSQRSFYEVRERPSRVYSWKVFILSQVLVEIPWQIFVGLCAWASFYFAVFGSSSDAETRGLILLVVQFYIQIWTEKMMRALLHRLM